jgi:hypothetical protein
MPGPAVTPVPAAEPAPLDSVPPDSTPLDSTQPPVGTESDSEAPIPR